MPFFSFRIRRSTLIILLPALALAQPPTSAPTSQPLYEYRTPSRDGTGTFYMGREIARYMSHLAADWLERPERDQEEHTTALLEALDLKPTDTVADVGCGSGYFTFRLATRVPQGKVFAEDIQPEMLDLVKARAAERNIANVVPVLGTETDTKLPENSVDLALLVDAYHEFDHPREMTDAIVRALKPTGRLVLVEYRGEDPTVPIKPLHKMTEAQAKKEMFVAGLIHVETKKDLPRQHILVFRKPSP